MTPRVLTAVYVSLLAFALALRLVFVFSIPSVAPTVRHRIESLNDEPAHFRYVQWLAVHRSFPVQEHHTLEPGAIARADFEFWQPPLYHLMGAAIYSIAGERAAFMLCRLLSFAFGVLSLFVLSRILALLDGSLSSRRLAVVFAALLPPNVYFTSLVSNDSLSWLISLLLTHEVLRALPRRGESPREPSPWMHARTGALLGAGMLTKGGLAIFYPVILLAHAWLSLRTRSARVLVGCVLGLALSVVIAAPWYARNLATYGSLFALEAGFGPPHPVQATLAGIYHTIGGTIRFFWFPMSHVPPVPIVQAIRSWGGVITVIHVAAVLWYARRRGLELRAWMLALLFALALFVHFRLNWIWGEAEARFLYPALAAIVFFFVEPIHAFLGRFGRGDALAWAWVVLAALVPWSLLLFASRAPLYIW